MKKNFELKVSHSVIFKSIIMSYREPYIYYSFWFLLEWSPRALTSRDISIYPIIRSVAVLTSPPVPQPRHLAMTKRCLRTPNAVFVQTDNTISLRMSGIILDEH